MFLVISDLINSCVCLLKKATRFVTSGSRRVWAEKCRFSETLSLWERTFLPWALQSNASEIHWRCFQALQRTRVFFCPASIHMSICFSIVERQASQQWPIHYASGRSLDTEKVTQERSQRDSLEIIKSLNFFPKLLLNVPFKHSFKKIINKRGYHACKRDMIANITPFLP